MFDKFFKVSVLVLTAWFILILAQFSNTYYSAHHFDISSAKPLLEDRYYLDSYDFGINNAYRKIPAIVDKFTGRFYFFDGGDWKLNSPVEHFKGRSTDEIQENIKQGW